MKKQTNITFKSGQEEVLPRANTSQPGQPKITLEINKKKKTQQVDVELVKKSEIEQKTICHIPNKFNKHF